MSEQICIASTDGEHTWVRRRDGKYCIDCGARFFGSSDLTDAERARLRALAQNEKTA